MTINRKYNAEEREEIRAAIVARVIANSTEQAPQTQEEFDKWAEKIVKEYHGRKAKEETRQQKRAERENQPGFKAKRKSAGCQGKKKFQKIRNRNPKS